jgi:hypothetical protein
MKSHTILSDSLYQYFSTYVLLSWVFILYQVCKPDTARIAISKNTVVKIPGNAIDMGCGTGTNLFHFAHHNGIVIQTGREPLFSTRMEGT